MQIMMYKHFTSKLPKKTIFDSMYCLLPLNIFFFKTFSEQKEIVILTQNKLREKNC